MPFYPCSAIEGNAIRYMFPTTSAGIVAGDAVRLPITGLIYQATTSIPVYGVALGASDTNSTQVAVCIDPNVEYWNESDSDLALAYNGLKFMTMSGDPGQIDASTGTTSGMFMMVAWKWRPGATTASAVFRMADYQQVVDLAG